MTDEEEQNNSPEEQTPLNPSEVTEGGSGDDSNPISPVSDHLLVDDPPIASPSANLEEENGDVVGNPV